MYKKQMTFQRIVCLALLVAGALVFIYSLGLMTGMYNGIYLTYRNGPRDGYQFEGTELYLDMQPFNQSLTMVGIGLILVSLFNFVMGTSSRRKYYIGNYVSIAVSTVCNVGATFWAMTALLQYKHDYLTKIHWPEFRPEIGDEGTWCFLNPETNVWEPSRMWELITSRGGVCSNSTFWFDVSYVVFGLLILCTVLLIVNMVLKIIVMNSEKRLIGRRKDVRA
ncbi:MAG: hypothetical protein K2N56_02670 [Oscillospiraceae bacterium]|nr:hypothetical protein [Oscillospiraceae bacterium]